MDNNCSKEDQVSKGCFIDLEWDFFLVKSFIERADVTISYIYLTKLISSLNASCATWLILEVNFVFILDAASARDSEER